MRSDNWNYNDGKFYSAFSGKSIVYLEINPCKCCPNSVLKVEKSSTRRRFITNTIYFENVKKELPILLKRIGAVELKPRKNLTEKEMEFWDLHNKINSFASSRSHLKKFF